MGTPVGLRDVRQGRPRSRLRLLAPLRYLRISHPEKAKYDFAVPAFLALTVWAGYMLMSPKPAIFGDAGVLRFTRDLLTMAVPFVIGALATVAMGAPQGLNLDRRPPGSDLLLDGEVLSLRQYVCHLLGYISFLGLLTLVMAVAATVLQPAVTSWTSCAPGFRFWIRSGGVLVLTTLLSSLTITVLWTLYFLADIINRRSDQVL